MEQDFGVDVARQMEVGLGENLLPQLLEIGELSVEAECEPLVLLDVVPLERLSVSAIIAATCGVPHVTNGRHTGVLVHQGRCLFLMVEVEDLGDGADILVRIDQLRMTRSVDAHSRG